MLPLSTPPPATPKVLTLSTSESQAKQADSGINLNFNPNMAQAWHIRPVASCASLNHPKLMFQPVVNTKLLQWGFSKCRAILISDTRKLELYIEKLDFIICF